MSRSESRSRDRNFQIGQHVGVIEADDLVRVSYVGDVNLAEVVDVLDAIRERLGDTSIKLLIDISELGSLDADARKYIATQDGLTATALFGGGFAQRVMANLMIRAIGMVTTDGIPTKLFGGESEARTWLSTLEG